jgi:hypothetical protein
MSKERIKLKQELNRLRRQKNILWGGVLFLVVILFWTSVSIFTSQKKVKIDQQLVDLTKPLVPSLDVEVFSMIVQKRVLSDEELNYFPIFVYLTTEFSQEGVLTDITGLSSSVEEIEEEIKEEIDEELEENNQGDLEDESAMDEVINQEEEIETDD